MLIVLTPYILLKLLLVIPFGSIKQSINLLIDTTILFV